MAILYYEKTIIAIGSPPRGVILNPCRLRIIDVTFRALYYSLIVFVEFSCRLNTELRDTNLHLRFG